MHFPKRIVTQNETLLTWNLAAGFWIMGGFHCAPARNFVFNEIATMLPRAILGKEWYVFLHTDASRLRDRRASYTDIDITRYDDRFGKEKVAGRKAVIPGLL